MPFFGTKLTGQKLGRACFERDQKSFLAGYPGRLFPSGSLFHRDVVMDEWLYFDASNFDYFVLLVFGDTAERGAITTTYWTRMEKWLQVKTAKPTVCERIWRCQGVKHIPREPEETGWQRMQRRLMMYAAAINTPHRQGESIPVSTLFCGLCGSSDAFFSLGVGQFYSSQKTERVKLLESHRTTPSPVLARIR
jgi:hypothetical protein